MQAGEARRQSVQKGDVARCGADAGNAGHIAPRQVIQPCTVIMMRNRRGFTWQAIGAEFSVVLKSIQRAAQMLEAGDTAEVAIQAEKMTTLIRVVNDTYFVAFSMTPGANIGKARYMLLTRVPALLKELT